MKISFNVNTKFLAGLLICSLSAMTALYVQPTKAQAVTSLSGQYGCILNRNYGGVPTRINKSNDFWGSNFMLYLDFNGTTAQMNVVGLTNWGDISAAKSEIGAINGALSIAAGPLSNSFKATVDYTFNNTAGNYATYHLMSVNGGNTLLVQGGTTGNNDSEPTTGVCNKV